MSTKPCKYIKIILCKQQNDIRRVFIKNVQLFCFQVESHGREYREKVHKTYNCCTIYIKMSNFHYLRRGNNYI